MSGLCMTLTMQQEVRNCSYCDAGSTFNSHVKSEEMVSNSGVTRPIMRRARFQPARFRQSQGRSLGSIIRQLKKFLSATEQQLLSMS